MDFLVACRAADRDGYYPHVGDVQWWFRDPSLENDDKWYFCRDYHGQIVAAGLLDGSEITCVVPRGPRRRDLEAEIRAWAMRCLEDRARRQGSGTRYAVSEQVSDDDPDRITLLESEGFVRAAWHRLLYSRSLCNPIVEPRLPPGYTLRNTKGEAEVAKHAALQHDAFSPYASTTAHRYLRVMRTPGYDPWLDLVVEATDGTLAAGCICWMDDINNVGLFEPLGTRPAFRRRGLAMALMLEGLRRLKARVAVTALAAGNHPSDRGDHLPAEFTASRLIYESVGFDLVHRLSIYRKQCQIP